MQMNNGEGAQDTGVAGGWRAGGRAGGAASLL